MRWSITYIVPDATHARAPRVPAASASANLVETTRYKFWRFSNKCFGFYLVKLLRARYCRSIVSVYLAMLPKSPNVAYHYDQIDLIRYISSTYNCMYVIHHENEKGLFLQWKPKYEKTNFSVKVKKILWNLRHLSMDWKKISLQKLQHPQYMQSYISML